VSGDEHSPNLPRSRRAILAASLSGVAAWVAGAIGRPDAARAGSDGDVVLNEFNNVGTSQTRIVNSANNTTVFLGWSDAGGIGVKGSSNSNVGVYGINTVNAATQPAVEGQSVGGGTGVLGFSGSGVGPAGKVKTGVYGYAAQAGSVGVWGDTGATSGTSYGVLGESHYSDGIGVQGNGWNSGTGVVGSGRVGLFATSTETGWMGVWGRHFGAGYGVAGDSVSHIGVSGTSNAANQPAIYGNSQGASTGVLGYSGAVGDTPPTAEPKTGVLGVTFEDAGSNGVWGIAIFGNGVHGSGYNGVLGESTNGIGISGTSDAPNHPAIYGSSTNNATGVAGISGGSGVTLATTPANTGVYGEATAASTSRGVWGKATSGQGVRGEASTGAAVQGVASNIAGYAFRGSGRVRFDKVSGVATIAANATSVVVTPGVDVTVDSFVLLTAMANIGTRSLFVTTDATNNRFTIAISSSRTSSTPIGWLLLR